MGWASFTPLRFGHTIRRNSVSPTTMRLGDRISASGERAMCNKCGDGGVRRRRRSGEGNAGLSEWIISCLEPHLPKIIKVGGSDCEAEAVDLRH